MKKRPTLFIVAIVGLLGATVNAQERVTAASDPDALFHSSDPKLDANKQVVYHVIKDFLEAGHVEVAEKYLTSRYLQHNPNIPSGRDNIAKMFSLMGKPRPIADKIKGKIVSVVAENDWVVVSSVVEKPDPKDASKTYTTTTFDMWRLKDGRVDEHWDTALLGQMGP